MKINILLIIGILAFLVAVFKLKNLVKMFGIFKFKIVYGFLVPLTLFILWVSLSVKEIYRMDNVLLQITTEYGKVAILNPVYTELTQGHKITGKFTSSENYLGIVAVRFWNFYRLNDDHVKFRIRELKQLDWYYENIYKVDQFLANGLFPFGFPIIENSAEKTYVFEIESVSGSTGNAIGLSPIEPLYIARYKYPKTLVLSSPKNIGYFLTRKILNLSKNPKFVASSFIYFLPLLIYFIYMNSKFSRKAGHSLVKNFVDILESRAVKYDSELIQHKSIFHKLIYKLLYWSITSLAKLLKEDRSNYLFSRFLVSISIIMDIFWVRREDATLALLIILWAFLVKIYSIPLRSTLTTAAILFFLSAFTWYSSDINIQFISERALSWSFLFIFLTAIHITVPFFKK